MIYYKEKLMFKNADIYYNHTEKPDRKVDVLSYYFVTEKQKKNYSLVNHFTILNDLSKSEDELFSCIQKKTRKIIREAKSEEDISCVTILEPGEYNLSAVNDFIKFYNSFAQLKNLFSANLKEIEQFVNAKTLCIRAAQKDNEILVMHQLHVADNRAFGQRSCSLFRNSEDHDYIKMISKANRLLHWDDMLYFKKRGFLIYDLGGWYTGQTDKELLQLNEFKKSFGGEVKQEYVYKVPVSFLGYLWIFLRSLKHFFKQNWFNLSRRIKVFIPK